MSKIHVYFMPGLAASSSIFEKITFAEAHFEIHYLEWFVPTESESLKAYAKKMSSFVVHEQAVLIGVSFGGILVQEMAQFLNLKKLIIISSVKSGLELPIGMKIAKLTKAYKLLPTSWAKDIDTLANFAFGNLLKNRLELYKKFLIMKDKKYLDWAIEQVVCWERTEIDTNVIHIHGDLDNVFPLENIKNHITVSGGTHIMIINRFKWFNENLPNIILDSNK